MPEEQQESGVADELPEEDAAERDRRNNEIRKAAEWAEFKRQTQVIQRSLPRPSVVDIEALVKRAADISNSIERSIAQEMVSLLANDALKYPIGGAKVHGKAQPVEVFEEDALNKARLEIMLEQPSDRTEALGVEIGRAWDYIHDSAQLPRLAGYGEDEIDDHQLMVEAFDVSLTITSHF